MFNDIIKKINNTDPNYLPSQNDVEEILTFIGKESELTSKIYKCYEFIQSKFIQAPRSIASMETMLKKQFGEIIKSNNINLRDYTMNMLIGMFFKLEENFEIFLDIYYTNIQRAEFVIEERNKKYDDNFYFDYLKNNNSSVLTTASTNTSSQSFEDNYRRILYVYENIDKKAFVMSNNIKISLIIKKLFSAYNIQIINFILVIMCFKIKTSLNKFEIEQERTFFRICYSQWKNEINFMEIISPAFESSISLSNRKVFLFSIMILFNSIGPNNFNHLLIKVNQEIEQYIDFIQKHDMSIITEHIAHLYPYLDTSRTFQHCFECIVGDLTTCEEETPSESTTNPLIILSNLMVCLELFFSEYTKRNYSITPLFNAYFNIQLLVIKFFNPYGQSKLKEKYNNDFIADNISSISFNEQIKTYETKHPLISAFINEIDVCDCRNNSLLYQNWLTLVYKNFALYDTYKLIRRFLFQTSEEKGLVNLIKLPTELNKYNTITWKKILNSVLENDLGLTDQESLNLIVNLKMLFYHEMSLSYPSKNFTFDSITYDYSAVVSFFKTKFDVLVGLFFGSNYARATNCDNNKDDIYDKNKMDIDEAFDTFMHDHQNNSIVNIEKDNEMAIDIDDNIDNLHLNQIKDESIQSKTKIEILKIYSLIISSYTINDKITPKFSSFALDLVDILIKQKEAPSVLNYIENVISLIIKLDSNNSESRLHPIHVVFNSLIRYLILKILKNETNAVIEKYYNLLLSIINSLQEGGQTSLSEVKQGIIYTIKQIVYKNADSQKYRNPLVVKNMVGLNDIDEKITEKKYIISLLSLLSKEEQVMMYGFYIRFLSFGVKELKVKRYNHSHNIIKLLKMLIEIEWLPKTYLRLVNAFSDEEFINKDKFLSHCISYLNDISPLRVLNDENSEKEIGDKKQMFQIQFRNILFDNASVIKKEN